MLTRDQAHSIAQKAISFSKFPDCSVSISESEQAFTRFANNGVTQAGLSRQRAVVISSTRDQKTGSAETTGFDDASLRAAVTRSEELAEISSANQEYVEPIGPQEYSPKDNWDEQTAAASSPILIPQVRAAIEAAVAKKLSAAGLFLRTAAIHAIANKRGNFGYSRSTDAGLSTTVRALDGSSSGWAGQPSVRISEISGAELGGRAVEKCLAWKKPVRIEPGKYTVVLEATAVSDLVQLLGPSFFARNAEEGRSFLSKKGGGSRVGEKLFPDFITLRSDPFDPRYASTPWSNGGVAAKPTVWVEKGVVRNLAYDRYWASKAGKQPTTGYSSVILEGGSGSLQDLIKSTERGLLVTRFWYIRPVNPQTAQLTGLTRDGLFLIEKGAITQPLINLRFNESPMRLLQNTIKLGAAVRCRGGEGDGMIAPPVLGEDFTFSSISDAV